MFHQNNGKVNINIQTKNYKIISILRKLYLEKQLNGDLSSLFPNLHKTNGGKYQTNKY